jgi:hypothetical protein
MAIKSDSLEPPDRQVAVVFVAGDTSRLGGPRPSSREDA